MIMNQKELIKDIDIQEDIIELNMRMIVSISYLTSSE